MNQLKNNTRGKRNTRLRQGKIIQRVFNFWVKAKPLVNRTITFTSSNFSFTHAPNPKFLAETNFVLYLLVHFETIQGKTDSKKYHKPEHAHKCVLMQAYASWITLAFAIINIVTSPKLICSQVLRKIHAIQQVTIISNENKPLLKASSLKRLRRQ